MMLSSWLIRRQSAKASSLVTSTSPSYSFGEKSAVCFELADAADPGNVVPLAPDARRAPCTSARCSLRNRPVPVIVPQVPRPATKCVTLPAVWRQISGPVVR